MPGIRFVDGSVEERNSLTSRPQHYLGIFCYRPKVSVPVFPRAHFSRAKSVALFGARDEPKRFHLVSA